MQLQKHVLIVTLATLAVFCAVAATSTPTHSKPVDEYLAPFEKVKPEGRRDGEYTITLRNHHDLTKHFAYVGKRMQSDPVTEWNWKWIRHGHAYDVTHLSEDYIEHIRRDPGVGGVFEDRLIFLDIMPVRSAGDAEGLTTTKGPTNIKVNDRHLVPLRKARPGHKLDGEYLVSFHHHHNLTRHFAYIGETMESDPITEWKWNLFGRGYSATNLTEDMVELIRRDPGVKSIGENSWLTMDLLEPEKWPGGLLYDDGKKISEEDILKLINASSEVE